MKAIQLVEPTKIEVTEVDTPRYSEHEVLIRVLAAGVCQSDVHFRHAPEGWAPSGIILGHENAGEVVEVGAGVRDRSVGDVVAVHPVWSCGACPACIGGRQNACRRTGSRLAPAPTPGFTTNGGMAEYMVAPSSALVGIGDLDPSVAATLTDAALTPYHSIRATAHLLTPGSTAVIIGGGGGLGRMAIQILRAITAARVVVLDIRDAALDAIRADVDSVINANDPTAADQVLAATDGYGAEVVLDLVGNDHSLAFSGGIVAPYGAIRAIGLDDGHFTFQTGLGSAALPFGASLTRPYSGTKTDLVEVVALAADGHLRPEIQEFSLDQGVLAFDELEAGGLSGRGVLRPGG